MTTAETAWTEAMRYENRQDPYRFFDELRKTPVVQVADKVYVVTGYRELLALAHDPHVSSDISKSPISAQPAADAQPDVGAEHMQAYGREPSLIVSDPAKHDKQRRQVMRHFAPPHSPDVIPNMAADIQALCNDSLDKTKAGINGLGGNVFDVVDDYAYPVPVAVICQILGVPLKDEPTFHGWIFDFMAGADMGPDAATEEGQARAQKGKESTAALTAYMAELIQGFLTGR
jgi:cytochrome P450